MAEDLVFENDSEVTAKEAAGKIKKLKEKLAVCEKEKSEYLESWQKVESSWRLGVEQIYKELKNRFKGLGVMDFGQIGERFDPNLHESAGTREVEKEMEDGIIIETVEK